MAGVRVTGLREVQRSLKKLGATAQDLKDAMSKISNKVVQDAKSLTPVRTGRLQSSVRGSKAQNKAVIRAGNNSSTKYASFVEYGSVHNEEEEMIRGAVTQNEQYATTTLENEIESLIERYNLN